MAVPATPPPTPRDPDSPAVPALGEPHGPDDATRRRPPVDLHWRPIWRGDEPDEIDQLLTPH